jgi:hypothetical protein
MNLSHGPAVLMSACMHVVGNASCLNSAALQGLAWMDSHGPFLPGCAGGQQVCL